MTRRQVSKFSQSETFPTSVRRHPVQRANRIHETTHVRPIAAPIAGPRIAACSIPANSIPDVFMNKESIPEGPLHCVYEDVRAQLEANFSPLSPRKCGNEQREFRQARVRYVFAPQVRGNTCRACSPADCFRRCLADELDHLDMTNSNLERAV